MSYGIFSQKKTSVFLQNLRITTHSLLDRKTWVKWEQMRNTCSWDQRNRDGVHDFSGALTPIHYAGKSPLSNLDWRVDFIILYNVLFAWAKMSLSDSLKRISDLSNLDWRVNSIILYNFWFAWAKPLTPIYYARDRNMFPWFAICNLIIL